MCPVRHTLSLSSNTPTHTQISGGTKLTVKSPPGLYPSPVSRLNPPFFSSSVRTMETGDWWRRWRQGSSLFLLPLRAEPSGQIRARCSVSNLLFSLLFPPRLATGGLRRSEVSSRSGRWKPDSRYKSHLDQSPTRNETSSRILKWTRKNPEV